MCEKDATAAGNRAGKKEKRPQRPAGRPPQVPRRRAQILRICASIGCRVTRTVLIGPVPVEPSTSETVTPFKVLTGAGAVGAGLLLYSTRRLLLGALKVISKITSTEMLWVVFVLATINTS